MTYRAEVIGSLLRPPKLRQAKKNWDSGGVSIWERAGMTQVGFGGAEHSGRKFTTPEIKQMEDEAVDAAIALQESAGLDVITDGEQRRISYFDPLFDSLEGIEPLSAPPVIWKSEATDELVEMRFPVSVAAKLRRHRSFALEEFAYARGKTKKPLKVTLPSPLTMTIPYSPEHSRDAYPDPFKLYEDAVDIINYEVRELAAAGCTYVQYDAAEVTMLCDPRARKTFMEDRGVSADRMLKEAFTYLNEVATCPGVTFGLHLCRGSIPTHYIAEGGYEAISKEVLNRCNRFDIFLLEYDDWRTGSFEPLADLPRDKTVVLGLVSAKDPRLESADELVAKIEEAAKYYPKENLAISSQCGFGSMIDFDTSFDIQEKKLRLVGEVARRVWDGK